jgi:hypothetical protein
MIDLNLRDQYLPNMKDFQKHMYQLSRLINENCNELYFHLEKNEISTSLYAASWFLSNISSSFIILLISIYFSKKIKHYFRLNFKWVLWHEYLISYFLKAK